MAREDLPLAGVSKRMNWCDDVATYRDAGLFAPFVSISLRASIINLFDGSIVIWGV